MILAHIPAIEYSRAELFELSLTAKTQVMRNIFTDLYCKAAHEELKKNCGTNRSFKGLEKLITPSLHDWS